MATSVWVGVDDEPTQDPIFTGQAKFADGTAAAPSITFTSETGTGWRRINTNVVGWPIGGTDKMILAPSALGLAGTAEFGWTAGADANAARDTILARDTANTLALRNGTNAQTFRAYNTFTDTANHEYGDFTWSANNLDIATRAAGTGVVRPIRIYTTGSAALQLGVSNSIKWNIDTSGHFVGVTATSGIGYAAGAGGTVTQATSKSTGVTLNTVTGEITLNGEALAADTSVSFTLTNSAIAAADLVVVTHHSAGTAGAYTVTGQAAAGSATITVRNITAGSLSEAIVLKFAVIKGATS